MSRGCFRDSFNTFPGSDVLLGWCSDDTLTTFLRFGKDSCWVHLWCSCRIPCSKPLLMKLEIVIHLPLVYIYSGICISLSIYLSIYLYLYTHIYIYISMCIYIDIYLYTCIYTYCGLSIHPRRMPFLPDCSPKNSIGEASPGAWPLRTLQWIRKSWSRWVTSHFHGDVVLFYGGRNFCGDRKIYWTNIYWTMKSPWKIPIGP